MTGWSMPYETKIIDTRGLFVTDRFADDPIGTGLNAVADVAMLAGMIALHTIVRAITPHATPPA